MYIYIYVYIYIDIYIYHMGKYAYISYLFWVWFCDSDASDYTLQSRITMGKPGFSRDLMTIHPPFT